MSIIVDCDTYKFTISHKKIITFTGSYEDEGEIVYLYQHCLLKHLFNIIALDGLLLLVIPQRSRIFKSGR